MDRIGGAVIPLTILAWSAACAAQPLAGQLVVDPEHPAWFKYQGGGPFYMCGPGDPEDFLYRGTRNASGTRSGDQAALIQKLIGTGANCIYLMAVRSHGGDGDSSHNPYVDSDLTKGLDNDILNQWEAWFTSMDDNGIVIYFIFYDDSASPFGKELPAGGQLKTQEASFIASIVGRFKHHKHLIWCVAEEYGEGLSAAHAVKIAEQIRLQDDRAHPIAIHQNHGTSFNFKGYPAFSQFAVQWNVATAAELHTGTLAAWNDTGGLVNINMSEFASPGTGAALRQKLWAIAAGGAYAMVLGMDIASTPAADLQACGHLVRFMEATRFNEASPHDELAAGQTDYVLASPGRVYIAYSQAGSDLGLSLPAGNYAARWYNPVTGAWIEGGLRAVTAPGVQLFAKPAALAADAALYVVSAPPAPATNPNPSAGAVLVPPPVMLSWSAGAGAASHEVYFGTTSPDVFLGSQPGTVLDPGPLEAHTTYRWRVDEVNENGRTTGAAWSFTTRGVPGDIDHDNDVDQADFGLFQACYSSAAETAIPAPCLEADLNRDTLVDQADGLLFLECISSPNVPGDPACIP